MDRASFVNQANWEGYEEHGVYYSEYSLRIEFNQGVDMADAIERLWSHPCLTGPWRDKSSFLEPPEPFSNHMMYGLITIDELPPIGCCSSVIPDVNDFLYLDIPFRMIQQIAPVNMPFDTDHNPWIPAFEKALAMIGAYVYVQNPYDEATIGGWGGWVSWYGPDNTRLTDIEVIEQGGFLLSPARWEQLRLTVPSVELLAGMRWIPRTHYPDPR